MFSFGIVHQGTDVARRAVREAGVTAAAFTLFAAAGYAQAASLPCRHSLSSSERFVCEDPELASLDDKLATLCSRDKDLAPDREALEADPMRLVDLALVAALLAILGMDELSPEDGDGGCVAGQRQADARCDETEHGRLAGPCRMAARAEPARLRPRTRNADALTDPRVPANGRGDSTTARTTHA
nr:hypothetical protein [Paraburkholderia sp. BL10I2N1]